MEGTSESFSSSGGGGDDAEEQRALYEAMQRNLALHRQPSPHPDLYPSVPFNGPFFRLHELSPDGRASRPLTALSSGAAVSKTMPTTPSYHHHNTLPPASPRRPPPGRTTTVAVSNNGTAPPPPPPPPGWTTRQLQEQRPDNHRLQQQEDEGEEEGLVVVWPPFPGQDIDQQQRRPKPEVPPPKNVRDNAQEYARQERMQAEAERQRAERDARLREKQFQAVKLQQDQLTRLATQKKFWNFGFFVAEPDDATIESKGGDGKMKDEFEEEEWPPDEEESLEESAEEGELKIKSEDKKEKREQNGRWMKEAEGEEEEEELMDEIRKVPEKAGKDDDDWSEEMRKMPEEDGDEEKKGPLPMEQMRKKPDEREGQMRVLEGKKSSHEKKVLDGDGKSRLGKSTSPNVPRQYLETNTIELGEHFGG
uniref:WH2 domain-containing protein n=1 Tax=Globodera pallida TaxID=36090 RepID=A0A183BHD9_GLOPA